GDSLSQNPLWIGACPRLIDTVEGTAGDLHIHSIGVRFGRRSCVATPRDRQRSITSWGADRASTNPQHQAAGPICRTNLQDRTELPTKHTVGTSVEGSMANDRSRLELSAPQVLGGALAAASAAVASSWLGVAGTVLGAVVVSLVASVGTALYS